MNDDEDEDEDDGDGDDKSMMNEEVDMGVRSTYILAQTKNR